MLQTSAASAFPPPASDSSVRLRDPGIFSGLARSSLRAAYAGAFAVVRRRADAEDVAQDALLAAFEKRDTCRDPACFRAWLLQIVRHRAINCLERRRLRDVPAGEHAPPGELHFPRLPDAGLRRRLLSALTQLSDTQRQVVLLHDTEGWTHQEIACRLGISVLMSRKHLFQARGVLRALLASEALPTSTSETVREQSGNAAGDSPVLNRRGPLRGAANRRVAI